MADELRSPETNNPTPPAPQPLQIPVDASALSTVYTNFCRASVTPEEIVLDFGLNPAFGPGPAEPVKLTHRVVMNFFTAKRLLSLLMNVVQQHESIYGMVEMDHQKRMRSSRPIGPPPGVPKL